MTNALQRLRSLDISLKQDGDAVLLTDPSLNGTREYDVGIMQIEDQVLSVEINFKSRALYQGLASALKDLGFKITDESDEITTLEKIFKSFAQ